MFQSSGGRAPPRRRGLGAAAAHAGALRPEAVGGAQGRCGPRPAGLGWAGPDRAAVFPLPGAASKQRPQRPPLTLAGSARPAAFPAVRVWSCVAHLLLTWAGAMAQVLRGTVTDFPGFDERADAETLRKAMKGLGTDEESILTLLTSRSNAQRQEIAVAFKTLFGRDLLDDLKSELTGKFEKLIVALMKPSRLYDAYELKHALKGAGTNEKVLTEIIASRTPEELRAIKKVYEEEYGSSLEDDVVGDTSGYYQRMLVVLLQANRDPDTRIDEAQVEQDAQALFQAGELKWGTDEEKFITIFGTRSVSHLRRVFDKYMTISGFQIEETIDRETSGNLEQLLLAVVKSIRSIPAYLAETLYYAMKGAGTDDHTLIRVVVSRSEIDLYNIRKEFRKNFATSLYSMIKGDTSGDYKKALLLLCGGEDD
ncbi:annexin A5 isoform X1 [Cervus elaphus]|uniref:annexin A5 isoform X1 n=2 Tax=Cervinae TaxID=34878 RepID=UPI001CC2D0BF|nr:annexin A5 isoform X1 [Cervus elaphus]